MQRREFLAASAATALGLAATTTPTFAQEHGSRDFFEIRTYKFASPAKQQLFEQFLAKAGVPAYNRAGVEPVGVFKLMAKDNPNLKLSSDSTDLYVFLPHRNFESVLTLEHRLAADAAFQDAGKDILMAPKSNPAFTRYESLLLYAFEGFPSVKVPSKSPSRVFELRTYESHSNERAINKVEMFNKGEFPVFERAGMPGVFFGSAIAGPDLPQLTYMIVHPDDQNIRKDWSNFMGDSEWKKLSSQGQYKDNVSKVISTFLRPSEGSQI